MIETSADYRGFVFTGQTKPQSVRALLSGIRSFIFNVIARHEAISFSILGVTQKGSGCTLQSFISQAPQKDFHFHPSRKKNNTSKHKSAKLCEKLRQLCG